MAHTDKLTGDKPACFQSHTFPWHTILTFLMSTQALNLQWMQQGTD